MADNCDVSIRISSTKQCANVNIKNIVWDSLQRKQMYTEKLPGTAGVGFETWFNDNNTEIELVAEFSLNDPIQWIGLLIQ